MNVDELLRTNLRQWERYCGHEFPKMAHKILMTLTDRDATEADLVNLVNEVNACRGKQIGKSVTERPSRASDDAGWPRQAEVARRLGFNKTKIGRLIDSGELTTNGKKRHQCRVDPASILAYCDRERITYNET